MGALVGPTTVVHAGANETVPQSPSNARQSTGVVLQTVALRAKLLRMGGAPAQTSGWRSLRPLDALASRRGRGLRCQLDALVRRQPQGD